MSRKLRQCKDGPLKGEVFNVEEGRGTGFFHKRKGTGRYLPAGDDDLIFEHWRKMTPEEIKEMNDGEETDS